MEYEMDMEPTGPQVTVREVSYYRQAAASVSRTTELTTPLLGGALPRRFQTELH
jgi:hypothetical protein